MSEHGMRIVYHDTLYNSEASMNVFCDIKFEGDAVHFASGGHRYAIAFRHIIRIEALEA